MARRSVTPAQRKRRILRDTLLLAVLLVVLVLRLDFPILTAEQALESTQARYFFGPGEIITNPLTSTPEAASPARISLPPITVCG